MNDHDFYAAQLAVDEEAAAALPQDIKDLIQRVRKEQPRDSPIGILETLNYEYGVDLPPPVVRSFYPLDHPQRRMG
jgi:hypothetical protein